MSRIIRSMALSSPHRMRGISLIELMVALLLGLLVVGGALSVFASNRVTYRTTENLGRVQENIRTAFELMGADIRDAASIPCANDIPLANVLDNSVTPEWWRDWNNGIQGFDSATAMPGAMAGKGAFGTGAGDRVAGTEAIELHAGVPTGAAVTTNMATGGDDLTVDTTAGIQNSDLLMVCGYGFDNGAGTLDPPQASIFQATGVGATTLSHAQGASANCQGLLGSPIAPPPGGGYYDCAGGTAGTISYTYRVGALLARYRATRWYVGFNGRVGCPRCMSLYQVVLTNTGAVNDVAQEVADLGDVPAGINPLQMLYLNPTSAVGDYVAPPAVANWNAIAAVRVILTLYSSENVGVGGVPLQRQLQQTVALRNRAP